MEILAVFIVLLFNGGSLYLIAKDLDEIENELKKRKWGINVTKEIKFEIIKLKKCDNCIHLSDTTSCIHAITNHNIKECYQPKESEE